MSLPLNLFTLKSPLKTTVAENRRLTAEARGRDNDVRHITLSYSDKFTYRPGQSLGVLVPGTDERTGKPHKLRLYSIASESCGDAGDGQTVSICVVRHYWKNPETGEKVSGVASNYLCDLEKGATLEATGPSGRHFLIPDDFKKRDFVFVATGTGIAPYRGMLKEMYDSGYEGNAVLYFGVAYNDVVLYDDEFKAYEKYANFIYAKAISREEKNPNPEEIPTRDNKMYVQARMYADRERLGDILKKPDSMIYLCGLKGMEQGIFPILEKLGSQMGVEGSVVDKLKSDHRLRVEVY